MKRFRSPQGRKIPGRSWKSLVGWENLEICQNWKVRYFFPDSPGDRWISLGGVKIPGRSWKPPRVQAPARFLVKCLFDKCYLTIFASQSPSGSFGTQNFPASPGKKWKPWTRLEISKWSWWRVKIIIIFSSAPPRDFHIPRGNETTSYVHCLLTSEWHNCN